jgi:hypothetical protein
MGDALHEMDERANYGAPGTYHRQLHDQLQSGLMGFDALRDSMIPKTAADAGQMAAYMTPGLGNALSARDAYEGVQQGDWRKAALGGIGAIPLIGGIFAGPLAKNMTPEERRATPPWETQDVPNEQQILRFW